MKQLILIAHNIRSAHNVGSLLRTADGLGVQKVYFTGYTPYPRLEIDSRLPHLAQKQHRQISKTALGAEDSIHWEQQSNIEPLIQDLRSSGYTIQALEQTKNATPLPSFQVPDKVALIVGHEVEGLEEGVLALCDGALVIPMFGQKESFNVVQAAAMALYHCRFMV